MGCGKMIKLGSKNGKRDKKISLLNRKRNKLKLEEELKEIEIKEQEEKKKKDLEILLNSDIKKIDAIDEIEQPEIVKESTSIKKDKLEDVIPVKKVIPISMDIKSDTKETTISKKEEIKKETRPKASGIDIVEKEIINILEENIKDLTYEIKKLDFDIHVIKKNIDDAKDKEELEVYEKQINDLIEKLNKLKKQLLSLEKTFNFDYPIEFKDNYLIYLVDEYKSRRKNEKELRDKIEEEKLFETIVDRIIDLEKKKDEVTEKLDNKKDSLTIQEDDLAKMKDEIINIDEVSNNIKNMIAKQLNTIKDIEAKVSETVHITERVETITKSVKHSLLDLIILMSVFKHNISIKNNAACAVQAAIALELINKMCTPIKEQVTIKETDLKDYEEMIKDCMDDTNKLLGVIKNNQKSLASIRYIFENNFKEYSNLPNYKDIMNQLDELDEKMEEAYEHTQKMNKEIEYQLEKNNARVLKYGSI